MKMSESTELKDSNICTTEDAFERFQASSNYEENEFIVLSDILPSYNTKQCSNESLKCQSENINKDVLLSKVNDELYVNTNKSCGKLYNDLNFPSGNTITASCDPSVVINEFENNSSNTQEGKKGPGKNDHKYFIENPNNSYETIQDIQNFIENTQENASFKAYCKKQEKLEIQTYRKSLRPKQPKNIGLSTTSKFQTTEISPLDSGLSEAVELPKKRGRPRKQLLENNFTNFDDSTININDLISKEINNDDTNIQNDSIKKSLRGKKSWRIFNTDNTSTLDNKINMPTSRSLETKTASKRGRPKKKPANEFLQEQLQTGSDKLQVSGGSQSEDDDDDVVLSKLSKCHTGTMEVDVTLEQLSNDMSIVTPENKQFKHKLNTNITENVCNDKNIELNNSINCTNVNISGNSSSTSKVDNKVDNMSLNKLKAREETSNFSIFNEKIYSQKRNSKKTIMSDFEYNIDSIVNDSGCHDKLESSDSLPIEDGSKRPIRRKTKQLHYDEGSDEDPFANLELTDDEKSMNKKSSRYYSDEEYIPGAKKGKPTCSESSDSEKDALIDEAKKNKRKKNSLSPRKRGRKPNSEKQLDVDSQQTDDIEECLEPSVIKANERCNSQANIWGSTNEFENFLAKRIQGTNLKIKKVSPAENPESTIAPLQIPMINSNEPKMSLEIGSQTNPVRTTSAAVQTSSKYNIPIKENITLTSDQSEKACEFLKSIIKTTAELGHLMTTKSEDFVKKKINTQHVTDICKMDYCVRKSFLLLELAKHNLTKMEDDLAQQYELFLSENKLSHCREKPLELVPNVKESDSDCEIIEETVTSVKSPQKQCATPKFNPKTVFLNKELSIKIAKKPKEDKNLNIKGKHTVWINDSVMVKKVKPTQSFLAQDSRNKKPPDQKYVTMKMVSDFFDNYNRQKSLAICAQYTSPDWITINEDCVCNYFINKPEINDDSNEIVTVTEGFNVQATDHIENVSNTNPKDVIMINPVMVNKIYNPETLFTMCAQIVQNRIYVQQSNITSNNDLKNYKFTDDKLRTEPETLLKLTIKIVSSIYTNVIEEDLKTTNLEVGTVLENSIYNPESLLTLSTRAIQNHKCLELNITTSDNDIKNSLYSDKELKVKPRTLTKLSENVFSNNFLTFTTPSLSLLCYKMIKKMLFTTNISINSLSHYDTDDQFEYNNDNEQFRINGCSSMFPPVILIHTVKKNHKNFVTPLFSLCFKFMQNMLFNNHMFPKFGNSYNNTNMSPKPLKYITYKYIICLLNMENTQIRNIKTMCNEHQDPIAMTNRSKCTADTSEFFSINSVNTLSEEAFLNLNAISSNVEENFVDFENNYEDDDSIFDNHEEHTSFQNNNWDLRLQINEPEPYTTPAIVNQETPIQVKLEPDDEINPTIVDFTNIKTEHIPGLNEMTIIPENFVAKSEYSMVNEDFIVNRSGSSLDADDFEKFLSSRNMSHNMEVFSQSALRVTGVHEPDFHTELDTIDSLLIPQTYKELNVENAKSCLMESNSDDDAANKKIGKKKIDKRKIKRKTDKVNNQNTSLFKINADKSHSDNEVANIITRLRNKIRQKERKMISSDSEDDDSLSVNLKKTEGKEKSAIVGEIQCNNVDSTEQINESKRTSSNEEIFKGFDSSELTELPVICNRIKELVNKGPSEAIAKKTRRSRREKSSIDSSILNYDGPVELLECEPIISIFDDNNKSNEILIDTNDTEQKLINEGVKESIKQNKKDMKIIERHGWNCYTIDFTDRKLYEDSKIIIEKLPETFVQSYLQYQDIHDEEDLEVDRLTNLNSLNRSARVNRTNIKERKIKSQLAKSVSESINQEVNADQSENANELAPSDDENLQAVDTSLLPALPLKTPENNIAKHLLMDDDDSDDGANLNEIKEKLSQEISIIQTVRRRPGPKSKMGTMESDNTHLMLTADKVMNKELTLLNGPVSLTCGSSLALNETTVNKKKKETSKKANLTRDRMKVAEKEQEDSSSEEEKQWSNTKVKLLKTIDAKENPNENAAKREKLVREFIEKRGEKRRIRRTFKSRHFNKKNIERQKQYSVLFKELYGKEKKLEDCVDDKNNIELKTKKQQRKKTKKYGKGCKKSKADSYPILDEESERIHRLNVKQSLLRKILGCEENETVQVIDGQVCLEYDFQTRMAVVSVNESLTKYMKEHQYAGVKFMWDACFESLSLIETGHPGSGCILAHCMGLGKTLQVLALLHTVLTHPRMGMRRVLVCCPLSTVLNWVDEINKWMPDESNQIKVFELSKLKRTFERAFQLEDWYKGGGIFIIGYELFRSLTTLENKDAKANVIAKIRTALLDPGPDIIVCDEGHLLKNDGSLLSMAMSRVATKRRIVLTGTPMQNNLKEYYCMVNFIKPNLLGTYNQFLKKFENPITNGQHKDSTEEDIKLMNSRTYILHKVLEGCLQRMEVSVMYPYLPKKYEYTVFITLTKCQWDLYKHYMETYAKQGSQGILKDFHVLQKIWSHPQVLHNFQTNTVFDKGKVNAVKSEEDLANEEQLDIKPTDGELWWPQYLDGGKMLDSLESSNKFVAVFNILNECVKINNKLLIFSTSLFTLDALEYFLKKINNWSLGQEYFRLDGTVPPEVRQDWCRKFNAKNNMKSKLFLISTRAGCLGLNLTGANRVIILDTSWNPAHDIQSIFRVFRFGQERDCYIYRLVAMGTMEQKIYERSVTKQAVACRVVDEQLIDRHYNSADLTELYLFDESGASIVGGVAVGVVDEVLLRVVRDVPIHAVYEHDSLLRGSSEEGLLEHERVAAWTQFQQEHKHKQIKNDPATTKVQKQSKQPKETEQALPVQDCSHGSEIEHTKEETRYILRANRRIESNRRRAKLTECCIPIQKETVAPRPNNKLLSTIENEKVLDRKVGKITELLIKYNYHNGKETETAALIKRVVKIMERGKVDPEEDGDDELCKSIADILMQEEETLPTAEDNSEIIISDTISDPTNFTTPLQKRRANKRKTEVTRNEITKSDVLINLMEDSGYTTRKKRRETLAADKCLETNTNEELDHIIENEQNNCSKTTQKSPQSIPQYNLDSNSDSESTDVVIEEVNKTKEQCLITEQKSKSAEIINKINEYLENDKIKKRKHSVTEEQLWNSINGLNFTDKVTVHNSFIKRSRKTALINKPNYPELKKSLDTDLTKTSLNNSHAETVNKNNKVPETQTEAVIDLTDRPDSPKLVREPKSVTKKARQSKATNRDQDVEYVTAIPAGQKESHHPKQSNKKSADEVIEVVPLHLSILDNANFVKVVANKYLKDNPNMLKETALLAAQYKIMEARKEFEAGRTICSGDIYEIAVEFIGIPILKQLHESSASGKPATVKKVSGQTNTVGIVKNTPPVSKVLNGPKETIVVRNRESSEGQSMINVPASADRKSDKLATARAPHPVGNVVPVRMFKGPANIPAARDFQQEGGHPIHHIGDSEECIVPDEVHTFPIVSAIPPTKAFNREVVPATNMYTPSFSVIPGVRKQTPGSNARPELVMEVAMPPYNPRCAPVPNTPASVTPVGDDTVVISDDEEPAVPVALTAARPSQGIPTKVIIAKVQQPQNEEPASWRINTANMTFRAISGSQKMVLPLPLKKNQPSNMATTQLMTSNLVPQQLTANIANPKTPPVTSNNASKPDVIRMIKDGQAISLNKDDILALPNVPSLKSSREAVSPITITKSRKQPANLEPIVVTSRRTNKVKEIPQVQVNSPSPQCTFKDIVYVNAYEHQKVSNKPEHVDTKNKSRKNVSLTKVKKNTTDPTSIIIDTDNSVLERILRNAPKPQSKPKEASNDNRSLLCDVVDLTDEPSTSSAVVNNSKKRNQPAKTANKAKTGQGAAKQKFSSNYDNVLKNFLMKKHF